MQFSLKVPGGAVEPQPIAGMGAGAYGVTNRYFTHSGKPVVPVMGEFQFSRWPEGNWRTEIQKMQAGGVQVLATYIFWIHHEEEHGVWDWSGCRNLRAFLEDCAAVGMPVVLRLGPWVHGECRNGGFPDWLQHKASLKLRSTDPVYLAHVQELYAQIFAQTRGFLCKDGGPVVAVQLENEYCGKQPEYILALKRIAMEVGFRVPFYTVTGWGGAPVPAGEVLPVMGAYPDAFWNRSIEPLPPSVHYLLYPFRDDSSIGAELRPSQANGKLSFDPNQVPFCMAEMGGGMQPSLHRRATPSGADAEALALCKLGIGCNLLGYYVYHGGTNPQGKHSTLQESTATGYGNDLPVKSYDFMAPLRETGEPGPAFHKLKRLHLFLQSFGEVLAPAECALPAAPIEDPSDAQSLRVIARHNHSTGGGFVFVNNHQRQQAMAEHKNVQLCIEPPKGEPIAFPQMDFANGDYTLLPYNLQLGESVLRSSNAQPLCRLGNRFFFFSTQPHAVYNWADGSLPADVVTLTPSEAEHAFLLGEHLYITEHASSILHQHGAEEAGSPQNRKFCGVSLSFCAPSERITCYAATGEPSTHSIERPVLPPVSCQITDQTQGDGVVEYQLTLGNLPVQSIEEALLVLTFSGDRAELYAEGELLADWFATGEPWRVALRRYGYGRQFTLKIYEAATPVYYEQPVGTKGALLSAHIELRQQVQLAF